MRLRGVGNDVYSLVGQEAKKRPEWLSRRPVRARIHHVWRLSEGPRWDGFDGDFGEEIAMLEVVLGYFFET